MTGCAGATATAAVEVNGPEDGLLDWDQVDWGQAFDRLSHDHILASLGTFPHGDWCAGGSRRV